MPHQKKFDPFKPQEPTIPGVSREGTMAPDRSSQPLSWIVIGVVLVISVAGGTLYKLRSASAKVKPSVADASAIVPPIEVAAAKPGDKFPVAPGAVATTEEMAKTWSSKQFMFRDPVTNQLLPAIVVRLPGGGYWGFSLREPFGNCDLEYVTDLGRLRTQYQWKAEYPMVIDPCNQTIYDLLKYGSGASNDSLVRGEIVQGPGIRPPIAIEIRAQGKQILAGRME
jgi:hypothetical protein